MAHPLDDGSAGFMARSIDATAAGLGADGAAWKRLFGGRSEHFDVTPAGPDAADAPLPASTPSASPASASPLWRPRPCSSRAWKGETAKALFGGIAAHAIAPLTKPLSASVGMALTCSGHAFGWPVARGGSRSITDALAAELTERGGTIETGRRGRVARRAAAGRRGPPRPLPRPRRRRRGLASFAEGRARVPPVPPRAGRVQGRLRRRRRRAVDGRGLPATPARSTWSERSRRPSPSRQRSTQDGCPSARTSWWASSTWRIRAAQREMSIPSGPTPTSPTDGTATRPRR